MSTLTDAFAPALSATLDPVVAGVAARRDAWVRVGLPERVALLRRAIDGVLAVGDDWVRAACHAKGIDPRSTLAGEEWISGPMTTVRNLRLLMEALEAGGAPRPMALRARPDGQVVADVFPHNLRERLMYSHMTVEVWIEPGQPPTQGRIYRDKAAGVFPPGRTCLVLGAGNVSSIGPLDVVHKLFVEDEVVVLKMNPVNDYLAPLFERAFAGLVELEVLAVVKGGADVGQYLCAHPAIDSIHLTGSDRTHDAIVWGETVEEQERRKAAGQPRIDKHVTSELGCVTPVLVVPGLWSERSLEFQARNVASMVAHNASFNCNAAKALVLARGWSQRDAFLEKLHEVFARLPARRAYYPGAEDRYRAFREHYPNARALGPSGPHVVPWTVIPNVPANAGEFALTREAFCGVLAEVSLDVSTADDFLREAVTFVNEHVWGTLSCVVIADGATQRRSRAAFDTAIADLRYGGIGINVWAGANFALGVASWGAFPGNTLDRVGSGIGVVHNTMLFDHPQKSIVRGPFRLWPTPVWFADHRNLADLGRRATFFEADPTWLGLPAVAWAGMKG
ncbi:MAG: aldehyde dehydrogenase family protein [Vicinamibacterales bacterium]|jgi:acyl-CoA reductase-like NAD-dependent aldehyde dehydrogenase|nr:aldehyde dehydrogenase family protein [Vicinamibacterales bacterium]